MISNLQFRRLKHGCAGRLRKSVLANSINKFGFEKNAKVFLLLKFALLTGVEPLSFYDAMFDLLLKRALLPNLGISGNPVTVGSDRIEFGIYIYNLYKSNR